MPNVDTIIAVARDTSYSATTYDGTTWSQKDSGQDKWKDLGGSEGKFIYSVVNDTNRLCLVDYAIIDDVTWNAGVMPSVQLPCIVAVARNATTLYTSYDGATFNAVTTRPTTYQITCAANCTTIATYGKTFTMTLIAAVTSTASKGAWTFNRTVAATSTSVASFLGIFVW